MTRMLAGTVLSACLVSSAFAQDVDGSWTKVMYLGGAVGVRGTATTWDGTITVTPHSIKLTRQAIDVPIFDIDPSSVTDLDCTDHKRGNSAAKAISPLLGGALVKSTDYYAMISFNSADGAKSAVLLRLDKSNEEAIIAALRAVTNQKAP